MKIVVYRITKVTETERRKNRFCAEDYGTGQLIVDNARSGAELGKKLAKLAKSGSSPDEIVLDNRKKIENTKVGGKVIATELRSGIGDFAASEERDFWKAYHKALFPEAKFVPKK